MEATARSRWCEPLGDGRRAHRHDAFVSATYHWTPGTELMRMPDAGTVAH